MMKQRQLGKNGPMISPIGYGAMSFSDFYGPIDEAGVHAILDHCLDKGLTHIDTADVYGNGFSESCIGSYLAKQPASVKDGFSLATKAGIYRPPGEERRHRNDKAYLEQQLDNSLKTMGVDVIDLFYVHRRDPDIPIEDVTLSLADFVKAGKIKGFGYSEIAPSSLRRANAVHHVMAVQSEYSLGVRSPELGLIQSCAELGTAFVAFSPVGRSLLTDKPHDLEKLQSIPFLVNNPRFMEPNLSANIAATDPFRALAKSLDLSAAGLAIAWLLHQGDHIIPIPGTRHLSHLDEALKGADFIISDEVAAQIDSILPIGWAHGDRYNEGQWWGPERYC
ncbi:MAG: aldo/keto reductase [Candidatus Puniceispirillaceae bacterium]